MKTCLPFIYSEHKGPVFCEQSARGVLHRLINGQQPPPRVLWPGLYATADEITVYNIRTALMNCSMEMSLPLMRISSSGLSMPLHLCVCQQKIPSNRLAKRLCIQCKPPKSSYWDVSVPGRDQSSFFSLLFSAASYYWFVGSTSFRMARDCSDWRVNDRLCLAH